MENKRKDTFLSRNTFFGLIMGLSYILAAYIFYKNGSKITLNPQFNNILMLLSITGAFIGVKKYQQQVLGGRPLTYGHALGTCVYLIAVASVVYGIFVYYLYRHSPVLVESYVSQLEAGLREVSAVSPAWEVLIQLVKQYTTAGSVALQEVLNNIFSGTIFSLVLAFMLRTPANFKQP